MNLAAKIKQQQNELQELVKEAYIAGSNAEHKISSNSCDKCSAAMHKMYTRCNDVLRELEDFYRAEHPKEDGSFYVPDKFKFYSWIVEKIKNIQK